MKSRLPLMLSAAVIAGCAHIVHMPPGTSVELALARKPEVLRVPNAAPASTVTQSSAPRGPAVDLPPVEPALPLNDNIVAVTDAFTRGREALAAGHHAEAISLLQQAVQGDPSFTDAWQQLALAYEKDGQLEKAREASAHAQPTAPAP